MVARDRKAVVVMGSLLETEVNGRLKTLIKCFVVLFPSHSLSPPPSSSLLSSLPPVSLRWF